MKLFSYVVARDYGFAPNPFHGCCTLATCKPIIRRTAMVGDWVVGTGSAENGKRGSLVYAMKVSETLTFDDYWADERYAAKKPLLTGSKKQAFGDNIYHKTNGTWVQANSHHSLKNGSENRENTIHDTQTDRVLIGQEFVYFGGDGPVIPSRFHNYDGKSICCVRGHKNKFPDQMVNDFVGWLKSLGDQGYVARPIDWKRTS